MDQSQSDVSTQNVNHIQPKATSENTVSVKTFAITVTILGLFLLIALSFLGYITMGSCDKTCSSSKSPSCPVGYESKCDKCSGNWYCGETKCTSDTNCTQAESRSNKENRSMCVKPSGSTDGYCYQCDHDTDCAKHGKGSMKCHRGWCSLCVNDSDCTTEMYDAPANGKCKNNVCVFDACNSGAESSASELAGIWPYTTDVYNDPANYKTCALKA